MDENLYMECFAHANAKIKTTTRAEIATKYNIESSNALRKRFNKEFDKRNKLNQEAPKIENEVKETVRINADKTITTEKVVDFSDVDLTDTDEVLLANGFDPKKFTLVSMTSSTWDGPGEYSRTKTACKLTVKPKEAKDQIDFTDIDNFFANYESSKFSVPKWKNNDNDGDVLEIPIAATLS